MEKFWETVKNYRELLGILVIIVGAISWAFDHFASIAYVDRVGCQISVANNRTLTGLLRLQLEVKIDKDQERLLRMRIIPGMDPGEILRIEHELQSNVSLLRTLNEAELKPIKEECER